MTNKQESQPWYIIGPGAMGLLWASYLRLAGHEVVLVEKPNEAREKAQPESQESLGRRFETRAQGVALSVAGENKNIDVQTITSEAQFSMSKAILAVKNYDVESALSMLSQHFQPHATVVLLQNGLGHEVVARALLPKAKLFFASVTHGAFSPQRYKVEHRGQGIIDLGPASGSESAGETEGDVADILALSSLDVRWQSDMLQFLWRKLIINVCINPLTALLDCDNGELGRYPASRELMANLCREATAVANAKGFVINIDEMQERVLEVVLATAKNRSSMRQDLQRGVKSENESISGFLVQQAKILNVGIPTVEAIYRLVKAKESMAGIDAS